MATYDHPPAHISLHGPSPMPPATGLARSYTRFPPQTSHTSPIYKRMGADMSVKSAPLKFIQPIGQGPQFHFTRPQSRDRSRPSSASGRYSAHSPQHSEDEDQSDNESDEEIVRPMRRAEKADFVLEELDSDTDYDSDTEVVRPDQYEDAKSEKDRDEIEENAFVKKFSDLQCSEGSDDEDEQRRSYLRKKKRWSAGIFKRSHSQSVGSDSDDGEQLDAHDVGSSARRLRRRVRGPDDRRGSLIFEDNGFPNIRHIAEVEEPDDGMFGKGPPSIPSDDGFTLDELPFWVEEEDMD
ncbi:hypothetical protein GQ43DRAFT_352407, partial [Delitschia confertaspora ATCC 74209]